MINGKCDMYVIGLQEIVELNTKSVYKGKDVELSKQWINMFQNALGNGYVFVESKTMVGLLIFIFVKVLLTSVFVVSCARCPLGARIAVSVPLPSVSVDPSMLIDAPSQSSTDDDERIVPCPRQLKDADHSLDGLCSEGSARNCGAPEFATSSLARLASRSCI